MKIAIHYENYTMPYTAGFYLEKAFRELGHNVEKNPTGGSYDLSVFVDPVQPHKQHGKAFYWEIDSTRKQAKDNKGEYNMRFIAGKDFGAYPDAVWLPPACDLEMHRRMGESDVDMVVVGKAEKNSPYPGYVERRRLIELAEGSGFTTFQTVDVWGDDYAKAQSRGKLILNRPGLKDMNMRFFESMAIGCMLWYPIGDYTEIATPGEHYVTFRNDEEFLFALTRYRNDSKGRQEIVRNARALVEAKHTYKHRALEMLSYL